MSAVKHALSQPLRKVSDPAIISKRIASPSPRLATPPSSASSSSTASEEDEIDKPPVSDKPSVSHTSKPEPIATPPPELKAQQVTFHFLYFLFSPLRASL